LEQPRRSFHEVIGIANKADIAQLEAVAHRLGMTDLERRDFGDFVEQEKQLGQAGHLNPRGDYSWAALMSMGLTFLEQRRGP
jgi:hypothetical protein